MKKVKHRKILTQVAAQIILLFAVIAIVNGILHFLSRSETYFEMLQDRAGKILQQMRGEMEAYDSLPWLLDYWQTHYSEMELPGSKRERTDAVLGLLAQCEAVDVCDVSAQQAAAFSGQEQRLFAEYCYLAVLSRYQSCRHDFELAALSCETLPAEDGPLCFFVTSAGDEPDADGNYYIGLGARWEFHIDLHPAIAEMQTERADRLYYETVTSTTNGVEYLYCYLPLMAGGDVRCVLSAAYIMTQIRNDITRELQWIGQIDLVIVLVAGALMLVLMYLGVVKNLVLLQTVMSEYRETRDGSAAAEKLGAIRTHNELKVLADEFSHMAVEIGEYTDELTRATAERERIHAELDMAAGIQASQQPSVFPAFPEREEFDLYAYIKPAQEVGGDFYDLFLVDEDHLALVMADVSDKGVPAALFMMTAKALIKNQLRSGLDPAQTLRSVNGQLLETNRSKQFVTVWLAVIELSTGRGAAANAGHEHPALRRAGEDYGLVVYKHAPPVAAIRRPRFVNREFVLLPGDSLFVYTDGVTEAENTLEKRFGTDRMLEALNRAPDASPEATLENVHEAIDAFVGEASQFDDITMLCLRYNGPAGSSGEEADGPQRQSASDENRGNAE